MPCFLAAWPLKASGRDRSGPRQPRVFCRQAGGAFLGRYFGRLMVNKRKASGLYSHSINRGSFIFTLTLASVFGLIAVWPFAPPIKSLTKESAHIQEIWKQSLGVTIIDLRTGSDRHVKCFHSKTGGCDPDVMKELLESHSAVTIWHDGEKVYQLMLQDKVILPYERVHNGRGFAIALSVVSLLIAFIQIAIFKGIIGVARAPR